MKSARTSWNLRLLYKSDTDPQIDKDVQTIEKACAGFERKYKNKDFYSSPQKLKRCLDDLTRFEETINNFKPAQYFHLRQDTDTADPKVQAKKSRLAQRLKAAMNKISFFQIALGKLTRAQRKSLLKSPLLKIYRYELEKIFLRSEHKLSEEEESLANLLAQPGKDMWIEGQKKLLNSKTVLFRGKTMPLSAATSLIQKLPDKERQELHGKVSDVLESVSHFAEAEVNAILNFRKVMDERRGYKKPYSLTVSRYENDEKSVENLVDLITKNFHISQRFSRLHAKLLGKKSLSIADRLVRVGDVDVRFDFASSVETIKKAFSKAGPRYVEIFERFLKNGQLDVYPRKGKRDGAYCSGGGDRPTFILLNHADDLRSFETIAHEMGHAFHTEFSREQHPLYRDYPISTAEVASTFFEQVALEELELNLDPEERKIALHNRILRDISIIFTQIAYFNFEFELHKAVRKEGFVPKEKISEIMSKHLRAYLGPTFKISDKDGYFFVRFPHMRYMFYVYTYAYGKLISKAMFTKWKKDPSYMSKVEKFMRAGGSMSPKDIFKSIGIDTSSPKFFADGLKAIEKDIAKLEKLSKKV